MEYKLTPVNKIPEYIPLSCNLHRDNHEHLAIIWRNSKGLWMGKTDMINKYCEINVYGLFIRHGSYDEFIFELVDTFYHEFFHLFFHYRFGKWGYAEKRIEALALILTIHDIAYLCSDYWYELFKDCNEVYNNASGDYLNIVKEIKDLC